MPTLASRSRRRGLHREHEGRGVRYLRSSRDRDRGRSACFICEHSSRQLGGDGEHGGPARQPDRDAARKWPRPRGRWGRCVHYRAVRPGIWHMDPGRDAEPVALAARRRASPRRACARRRWRRVHRQRRAIRPGDESLDADREHECRPPQLHRHAPPRRARARRRRSFGERHRRAGERRAVRPGDRPLDVDRKPPDAPPRPYGNAAGRRHGLGRGGFQFRRALVLAERGALRPRPRTLEPCRADDGRPRARQRDPARQWSRARRRRGEPVRNGRPLRRALRSGLGQVDSDRRG